MLWELNLFEPTCPRPSRALPPSFNGDRIVRTVYVVEKPVASCNVNALKGATASEIAAIEANSTIHLIMAPSESEDGPAARMSDGAVDASVKVIVDV
jgi:hypothetical protein